MKSILTLLVLIFAVGCNPLPVSPIEPVHPPEVTVVVKPTEVEEVTVNCVGKYPADEDSKFRSDFLTKRKGDDYQVDATKLWVPSHKFESINCGASK